MTVKRILIVLEILMALWFAAPFVSGIINAGNLTGLFICAVLILATVFSSRLFGVIMNLWGSAAGKVVVSAAALLIAAVLLFMVSVTVLMIHAQNNHPDEPVNIVVLGCKVNGEKPSKMLRMRLEAAEKYLAENEGVKCVVSGGKGSDEEISEAQAMKNYLLENGIDEDRIIIEDESENTLQNIEYSIKKLEERGYERKFAIVTDGFHQYRAGLIAEDTGAEIYAVSAKIANPALLPTYYVREWLAIAREYARKII
ncbi:MAG: YdcF family protein [Porcipelethomonas sp.]